LQRLAAHFVDYGECGWIRCTVPLKQGHETILSI